MGPTTDSEVRTARDARLEVVHAGVSIPEDLPVHLKIDTGMGRWGLSELPSPTRNVVGVMSHLAVAESDPDFTHLQIDRFRAATADLEDGIVRHIANSAGTLRYSGASFDAVRCGIALYGISAFDADPALDGLEPALRWDSYVALAKRLEPGDSTGYGRQYVAAEPTWIGVVPVGYADGFRRDMTGTEVLVDGERRRVVGAVSMDALAVELAGEVAIGTPVTLIGDGVRADEHARVAETIGYEIVTRLDTSVTRGARVVRE